MHENQLEVTPETARALIDEQFPEWSHLPLRALVTTATVNTIFRLGDGLSLRFPLLGGAPERVRVLLREEAEASVEFLAVSPVPAPSPVALGEPGHGYPLPWSVQTWLPGEDAFTVDPASSAAFADDLANLLRALRAADTGGRRFSGGRRGGHLPDQDDWMEECFKRSDTMLPVARLRAAWSELRTLPQPDRDVLTHGDLTPPNVLVHRGRLAGVLDTGGFGPADPALDLVGAWHLLDQSGRSRVRTVLGCSDWQWLRGMAWAFAQAMGLVWYYAESNPGMARWGKRSIERLLAAPELSGL